MSKRRKSNSYRPGNERAGIEVCPKCGWADSDTHAARDADTPYAHDGVELMENFIMETAEPVHHRDHDSLNNRDSNLFVCESA
jgi:hypothetical protein